MLMVALWLTMAPAFPAQRAAAHQGKRARHNTSRTRYANRARSGSHRATTARQRHPSVASSARRRTPVKSAAKRSRSTYSRQKARNIA